MTIEDVRAHVRTTLEGLLGVDGTTYLMDRPPGGWSDLATHRDVDLLEARMNARFDQVDRRFTSLEATIDAKLGTLEATIDAKLGMLEATTDARIGELEARFDAKLVALEAKMETRFASLEARFDGLETRFDGLGHVIDSRIDRAFNHQLRWIVGTMIGWGAILVAALKV